MGGQARSYRLFVPTGAQGPAPVVVVLHDAGGTGDSIAQASQFDRAAAAGGFAVAYPESLRGTWNGGFCCGTAPGEGIDDVAFLDRLVDALSDDPRIDPDLVHLAGVSNGAIMAYRFACEHPTRIAGVGSVAGTMVVDRCQPTEAVPVIEIHGTADQVVPFDGGQLPDFTQATQPVPSAIELAQHWATANGCAQPTTRTEGPVSTTTWEDCRDETSVRLVAIEGAGHTWYAREFGPIDGAIDATETIATFFGLGATRGEAIRPRVSSVVGPDARGRPSLGHDPPGPSGR